MKKSKKQLYRSTDDRLIAGVLGGFAEYFGFDSTWVRVIYAILLIPSFFTLIVLYILLWFIIPKKPDKFVEEQQKE